MNTVKRKISFHQSHTFRSDARPLLRICAWIAAIGSPLLFAAAAIGQHRAHRFPSYPDLLLSALVPVAAAAALAVFFSAAIVVFTVKVLPGGLPCYDLFCRYQTVQWSEITDVEAVTVYGLPYLYVGASNLTQPITLPLWLNDLPNFVRAVEAQAGHSNVLVKALREAS